MINVRMSWMDVERSCSADVLLPKDSKDIPPHLRNKLYHHRAQVASMIRRQLAIIQRELDGDVEEEHDDATKAVEAITALIKGQRYRDGKTYTSYIDGTSHEGCQSVTAYNTHCRQRLDALLAANKDITAMVPDASEFDVQGIEAMLDEEAACTDADERAKLQEKIEAARSKYNDRATKCSRYLSSFVAIRNAKLSEGFDPNTVAEEEEASMAHSYTARSQGGAAPATADNEAKNESEEAPEQNEEEAAAEASEETPAAAGASPAAPLEEEAAQESSSRNDAETEDDEAKIEQNNAAIIEGGLGDSLRPPELREGTTAPPRTTE